MKNELTTGRTPEEIKRILSLESFDCSNIDCPDCEYIDICKRVSVEDCAGNALALIERLESERDAALAKVPKWISVEERLPPAMVKVWMYSRLFDQTIQGMMSKSDPTLVFCEDGSDWHMSEITHWMPLPEPPKGE